MNQPAEKTGYPVIFSGVKGYPEETMRRARAMLEALLNESDAPQGDYMFGITGLYPPFEKLATARLEVERGKIATAVLIRLRSRGGSGGSIVGSLYFPSGVSVSALFQDMVITADNFNRGGGWVEALQNLPPNPSPRGNSETPVAVDVRKSPPPHLALLSQGPFERERASVLPRKSVAPVSVNEARVTLDWRTANPTEEVPMSTPPLSERSLRLAEFLRVIAKRSAASNGVFPGAKIAQFSGPIFPGEKPHWLGQGILFELEGLGWIRHVVGKGQYQIDPEFAEKHALDLIIEPLPRLVRGQGTVRLTQGKKSHGLSLEALLEQQRALDAQIREAAHAKQREWMATIEKAKADVVKAEAGLIAHNKEYAHLLTATPPGVNPETPTS